MRMFTEKLTGIRARGRRNRGKSALPFSAVNLAAESAPIQRAANCACGGGCPRCQNEIALQSKLRIGQPNDKYEQEADRVADQVMRMPQPAIQCQPKIKEENEDLVQTKPQITPLVQCRVGSEEEEEVVHAKHRDGMVETAVSPTITSHIHNLKGNGQPLSASTRRFFEPRFGHDFSQVRIHTGSRAAETARALQARAFTLESDVVLGDGQYKPELPEGKRLLAHELTHVVQQTGTISGNVIRRENSARARPWQEVNAQFVGSSRHPIHLFSHDFGSSTSAAAALQWIFYNSMARPTSFQFVSERETINTEAHEIYLRSSGQPLDQYQEVALVWHLRRRRFVAYTTRHPTSGAIDPRQSRHTIFVAHTHPTQSQVPGGGSSEVTWQTMSPSPNDSRNFHPRQTVSIICHRDPADNQTPVAFVYNRSRQVLARYRGSSAFQSAAAEFRRRERSAGTLGRRAGQYS